MFGIYGAYETCRSSDEAINRPFDDNSRYLTLLFGMKC